MVLDPANYSLEVSQDKMEATFRLLKVSQEVPITKQDLLDALATKGIKFGVATATIDAIAARPAANVTHVIAEGKPAKAGTDDQVDYSFPTSQESKFEESETGTVDFRNIQNFCNVHAGDVLAVKTVREPAVPGSNVLGEEIKGKEGKAIALKVGKGVRLSDDQFSVSAEIEGHACLVNDRITVLNTVEVPGDVDYSVGNISFIGNVKIRGGVMPGFKVEAEGDIEVAGNVEKAEIICGGNLVIRGIVFGHEDCKIEVKGDAQIGAVDQALVMVHGALTINSYIRHCKVLVGDKVVVSGQKGNIVGGELHAMTGVTSSFIGNSMATLTRLTVGSNPFVSQTTDEIKKEHDDLETKLEQINNALGTLRDRISKAGGKDPKSEAMMAKLKIAQTQTAAKVAALGQDLKGLLESAEDYRGAKIKVSDIIYPGVVINFRDKLQYKTMDEAQRVSFYEEEAEIRTGPL